MLAEAYPRPARRHDVLPVPAGVRGGPGGESRSYSSRLAFSTSSTLADQLVDVGAGGVEHQVGILGRLVRARRHR